MTHARFNPKPFRSMAENPPAKILPLRRESEFAAG